MRVWIVGQKWLGASVLDLCRRAGHRVIGVSAPTHDRLAAAAAATGVPSRPVDVLAGQAGLDLLLVAHAHVYVPTPAILAARHGALGYHPSLLPRHRGRDAIRWTVKMGDPITGGTLYWLDEGVDTGALQAQDWCFVRPGDTPESLWRRELAPLALRLFEEALADIAAGRLVRRPQDERHATWEPAFARPPLRSGAPALGTATEP